ncbi:YjbQ family protein [Streptomyces sp. AV19]|uniref:secondary thiamine-phosphate synthase enzyme YjbQ n=1 Tax=Streptomyces sp. AV19 TaxID=2793068 RepID=UPI0018FEFA60|nr:secondary thiamine-phosphate synthase enzyme YjbQ [Streptomyces sp. AV19]MBH1932823.1 YjbQ family protein [Streptomyces sp. AV19]MDG4531488.1 secondary thiamine-phosphate synthase enzyme YjbQ [Streptomyces sp. AV19]
MTTVSGTHVSIVSQQLLPAGSSVVVSARLSVGIGLPEEAVDLTGELRRLADQAGVGEGTLHIYCGHTTCGLVVNENEGGLLADMKAALARFAPHSGTHYYAHDKQRTPAERALHGQRDNGHSHLRALIATHPELSIPITEGELYLGRWQSVLLAEFDGPRTRELLVRVHRA